MRSLLLATAVILTVRTLVLATASSMVMATAGAVFAERASITLQRFAVAKPSPPPHPADPGAEFAASRASGRSDRVRLARHSAAQPAHNSAA